ncbi:VOC family protein [Actinoplanes sp. NPDC051513]|uniref:VOC family protein n=1 Tax=Actinoplanes sp. NPDC051513 TaxID=3363908 RepID=UPI0037BC5789
MTTRQQASEAVYDDGWRFLLGTLRTSIPVTSLAVAASVAARAVEACGADALDIPAVRPFWAAITGGEAPPIWFQQMDAPRPQRNRIHLDICVPHDEVPARIEAALAAGGHLVSDTYAPAFWVLADPEGNEACITTWQGRD